MWKRIPLATVPISSKELRTFANRVLAGESIIGKDVRKFEGNLANYLGVSKTFAFNSGRTALYVALQALNLERGDEVLVPAYTCPVVFEVILRLGLKPVFVDADSQTYNIDPELLPKAITSKTKVVIPVHLFGRPCNMDPIVEIAEKNSLYIIEDAAQAIGAEYKREKIGTFGDLAIFSFGPGKVITSGSGGAVALNNSDTEAAIVENYEKLPPPSFSNVMQLARNIIGLYVFSNRYAYPFAQSSVSRELEETDKSIIENILTLSSYGSHCSSLNETIVLEKMPNVSGAIASYQLEKIDTIIQRRKENSVTIFDEITKRNLAKISIPPQDPNLNDIYTRCVVKTKRLNVDLLIHNLMKEGIEVRRPYKYLDALYTSISVQAPNSLRLIRSALALPNHPCLDMSDTFKIVDVLEKLLKQIDTRQVSSSLYLGI